MSWEEPRSVLSPAAYSPATVVRPAASVRSSPPASVATGRGARKSMAGRLWVRTKPAARTTSSPSAISTPVMAPRSPTTSAIGRRSIRTPRPSRAASSAVLTVPTPLVNTIRSSVHCVSSSAFSARSAVSPISASGASALSYPSQSIQLCRLVPYQARILGKSGRVSLCPATTSTARVVTMRLGSRRRPRVVTVKRGSPAATVSSSATAVTRPV